MTINLSESSSRTFGTFPLKGKELAHAVSLALETGYRAFDTAQMYGNEADLGHVLKNSGFDREQLFVVTKIHPDHYSAELFFSSIRQSLKDLQTEYVDLLLLHWPPEQATDTQIAELMELLNQSLDDGFAKQIGVSNFNCHMLKVARDHSRAKLFCNQVEFHPLLNQFRLLACADSLGIPLSAYCSNARGKVRDESLLVEIGNQHGKSAVQVALRWALQHGVMLNTMSTKRENIESNFNLLDFELCEDDMKRIDGLSAKSNYRIVTSDVVRWAPDWD